jgi:F0F1-type ATP synthase assembly protein I
LVSDSEKPSKPSVSFVRYADLGLRFTISVGLCSGGGYWLDTKLNTLPLFMIVGMLLGATSGFVTIYRAVYPPRTPDDRKGE